MSVRIKLLLFFIIATLPVGICAFFIFSIIGKNIIYKETIEKLNAIASIQEQRINEVLDHFFDEAEIFSSNDLAENIAHVTAPHKNDSEKNIYEIIATAKAVSTDIREITVYDNQKNIVTSTNKQKNSDSHGNFLQTTPYLDKIFFDKTNTLLVRTITGISLDKKNIGYLEIITSAEPITEITNQVSNFGETGEVVLAERNAQGDAVFITPLRFEADSTLRRAIPNESYNSPIIQALRGEEKNFSDEGVFDYRGVEILAASRFIPAQEWGLVVKIDRSEVMQPIYHLQGILLVLGLIFYSLALGIWLISSSAIITPIHELIKAVKRITQGDFAYRATVHSNDEIGQLAESFNSMTNSVQESRLHLEQKVTERTSELQIKLQQLKDAHLASLNILEDLQEEKKKIESKDARDEAILASIGDGMITTDAKGKILLVNTRAESLLGIQSSKACGKNITDIWKIADAKERLLSTIHHPAEHVLKDQKIIERSDYFYVDKHHKRVPAAMTIAPVILEKKLIGMIAVFRDITHEKEVDRAKTEFVSLASHQLRTPLSAINWYTEMLLDGDAGKINKEQRHYLEEIYHGNKRMVDLVNALLNTSRIDLGTFAVEPKIVNVIDISKMVLLELQPQIAQKKIHLTENYSPEIPVMKADPKLLKIIFQNLLSNAVKYTPDEGNVSINVDVTYHTIYRSLGKQKDGILVTVTDTGYGIPKEQQGKIFTKLFRADNVREKDTEGTGLGLYIVRSIVNQAGGKIWFTSEENKGTTFFVQLPLIGMKKKTGTKSLS